MACCPCSTRAYGPTGRPLPALDRLRAHGVRLAIVSNAARHSGHLLDAFGLRDRVDVTAMSWSTGLLKPDPRIYQVALEALGTDPGRAAFVGDGRDHELQGARQLGLQTVLIERDLAHTESARAEADLCCASLTEATRALLARCNH
jgi:putative hydrolase of the HAD superfamily